MKLVFTALIFFGSHAMAATPTACADHLKATQEFVTQVRDRFRVGEVTRTDVANAEIGALQAKYACEKSTKAQYCQAVLPAVEIYRQGVEEEARVGQRSIDEVVRAENMIFTIRRECEI